MNPVELRIRIRRIVSDVPLEPSFAEFLSAELSSRLSGQLPARAGTVEAQIANSVILSAAKDLGPVGRSNGVILSAAKDLAPAGRSRSE